MSLQNIQHVKEDKNLGQYKISTLNQRPGLYLKRYKKPGLSITETKEKNHLKQEKDSQSQLVYLKGFSTPPNSLQMITKRSYNSSRNFQIFYKYSTPQPKLASNHFTPFTFLSNYQNPPQRNPFIRTQRPINLKDNILMGEQRSKKKHSSSKQKLLPDTLNSFIFPEDLGSIGILQPTIFCSLNDRTLSNRNVKDKNIGSVHQPESLTTQNDIRAYNMEGLFEFIHKKERYGFISSAQLKKQVFFHLDDVVGNGLTTSLWAMNNRTTIIFDCLDYISKKRRRTKAVNIRIIKS